MDVEVLAIPQEIVDFYKQAMTDKGWKPVWPWSWETQGSFN